MRNVPEARDCSYYILHMSSHKGKNSKKCKKIWKKKISLEHLNANEFMINEMKDYYRGQLEAKKKKQY